jgi:RNA polymerase sigma factor (sigma-70 family)
MIETGGLMFGIPDAARQDTPLRDDVLQLGRLLDRLAPRQGQIIRERFLTERTLKEVGMEFHITRERVRQIEAKALARLRMFAGSTPPAPQEEART